MMTNTREYRINSVYAELCAMYDADDLRNDLLLDQISHEAESIVDIEDWIASTPREERCRKHTILDAEPVTEPEPCVIEDDDVR